MIAYTKLTIRNSQVQVAVHILMQEQMPQRPDPPTPCLQQIDHLYLPAWTFEELHATKLQ